MKTRRLGNTSLTVTELGLGGASIGNLYEAVTDTSARETMEIAWSLGIRFFDTAPEYGHGLSERRMGDALRSHPRDEYILANKVGDFLFAKTNELPAPNKFIDQLPFHLKFDYTYDGIMRSFEDGLQRLGLNRVDMVLVHDLDPIVHDMHTFKNHFETFLNSGYQALAELREQGIIQAIGLGVKKWEVCRDVMQYGDYDCFMLQGNYTLLEQPALHPLMDECLKKQISILLAGPFASGILATGPVPGSYFHHREADKSVIERVRLIQEICDAYHTPLAAAAIQFPLKHPVIASVVMGAAHAKYLKNNVEYYQFDIPNSCWSALQSAGIIPKDAPI